MERAPARPYKAGATRAPAPRNHAVLLRLGGWSTNSIHEDVMEDRDPFGSDATHA